MNMVSVAVIAVTALVSGAVGYSFRQPLQAAAVAVPDVRMPHVATPSTSTPPAAPLIALASDGNVTLHVDQQPLAWVLEQITLQGGDVETLASAAAVVSPLSMGPACPEPARVARVEPEKLLHEIERGTEAQRIQGLLEAGPAGLVLPDDRLKNIFETDASDRVRLQAFEAYLERQMGDNGALRRTLEAAVLVPSAAIQREASARLHELTDTERIDASSHQRTGS